jgi:hypothetical protein
MGPYQKPLYYIRHGNIAFAPIMRRRLSFAVMVRRAAEQLGLARGDSIAVELPPSIEPYFKRAVAGLPRIVKVIVAADTPSGPQEAFPVTPCDGIVEAVRLAKEREIHVEYIDAEVSPAALWQRHCMLDDSWPDDDYALYCGAEQYMSLLAERIEHPPSRIEPVDTAREACMARRLQVLSPLHRRILVICDAARVNRIAAMLRSPARAAEGDVPTPLVRWRVMQPNPAALLSYLDEIPHLVEMYEERRDTKKADGFDKFQAVLECIGTLDLATGTSEHRWSVRHYDAFVNTLRNLREYDGSLSPRMDSVLAAADGCFGPVFGDKVRQALLAYYNQIDVERIVRTETTDGAIILSRRGRNMYVARSCDPRRRSYIRVRRKVDTERPLGYDGRNWMWPTWTETETRLRQQAMTFAAPRAFEQRVISHRFQGSIESGLDLRRSVHSLLRGLPQLYVRRRAGKVPSSVDPREPLVWLFPDAPLAGIFMTLAPYPEQAVILLTFHGPREQLYPKDESGHNPLASSSSRARTVTRCMLGGLISFVPWERNTYTLKRLYEADYAARVPLVDAFELREPFGYLHKNLFQFIESDGQLMWRDILILTALKYAARDIYVVAPDEFKVSNQLSNAARVRGRNLVTIPIRLFDAADIEKLRTQYAVSEARDDDGTPGDNQSSLSLREKFSDLMKELGID